MSAKLFDELDDPELWSFHKVKMDWLWRDANGWMRAKYLKHHRQFLVFLYWEEWEDPDDRRIRTFICDHGSTLDGICVHCDKVIFRD